MKDLIAKREDTDRRLAQVFGGATPLKKVRTCKLCGESDHDARSCRQASKPAETTKLI